MMQSASTGVRLAARKGSNTLVHHGSGGPSNHPSKSIHTTSFLRSILQTRRLPSIPVLPPRDPHYRLFSASKNFLQRLFAHLTAPGLRAPAYLTKAQNYSARSLHGTSSRGATIQNGLSLPVRIFLRNHALQQQAYMFLPRGPRPLPPRFGGVAQVGLGLARNFSTARPLLQQIAHNVPVAGRALYEIDWNLETRKEYERMRIARMAGSKKNGKAHSMLKAKTVKQSKPFAGTEGKENIDYTLKEDIEHYFPSVETPLLTTYLFVPLAPTPTARLPLPLDPSLSSNWEPGLLPPLSYISGLHAAHSTHALRVSTLFTRLDQANVWPRGDVHCSAFSQGLVHQRKNSNRDESQDSDEGVCTVLRIEFKGWSQSEVRGVIGESGTGWCILEEVHSPEGLSDEDIFSDSDSIASSVWGDEARQIRDDVESTAFNPTHSFIIPTLDVSSAFSPTSSFASSPSSTSTNFGIPTEMESDPRVDAYLSDSIRSYSDLSNLIIDPPSFNGWVGASRKAESHLDWSS